MAIADMMDYLGVLPALRRAPAGQLWASYDADADVMYVSFRMPNEAESTDEIETDILERTDAQGEVIGYTILNASRHGIEV